MGRNARQRRADARTPHTIDGMGTSKDWTELTLDEWQAGGHGDSILKGIGTPPDCQPLEPYPMDFLYIGVQGVHYLRGRNGIAQPFQPVFWEDVVRVSSDRCDIVLTLRDGRMPRIRCRTRRTAWFLRDALDAWRTNRLPVNKGSVEGVDAIPHNPPL